MTQFLWTFFSEPSVTSTSFCIIWWLFSTAKIHLLSTRVFTNLVSPWYLKTLSESWKNDKKYYENVSFLEKISWEMTKLKIFFWSWFISQDAFLWRFKQLYIYLWYLCSLCNIFSSRNIFHAAHKNENFHSKSVFEPYFNVTLLMFLLWSHMSKFFVNLIICQM